MPQMAPLPWLIIFVLTLSLILISSSMIYFIITMNKVKLNFMSNPSISKKIKW
uniref:ATP synthase F0 subunit 8 n=1 Tax=Rhinocola aceris TaxID=1889912 RepID=A0A343KN46_9HEMI|nr:ATP synthase F0 subunit 8 [Rhinocola aceris]